MLRWRLLMSALLILPLVGLLFLDLHSNFGGPGIWLWPVVLVCAVLAVAEVLDLFRAKDWRPAAWSVYSGTVLVVGAGCLPVFEPLLGAAPRPYSLGHLGWPAVALAVSVALAFLGEMVRFERPGQAVVNVALAFFAIAYVGFLVTFLVALRLFHSNEWGMLAVVSAIAVTKMSDTGAYTWGRLLGRHKMTPILSPKKTIEGGIGGLLTAAVSAWLFFIVFVPLWAGAAAPVPAGWRCGLYGLIVGAAGTCGDLCESLLKRDLERKDSSRWMPGLGGVLDVLDSLLLAAPAAFFCWAAGLLGPS